MDNDSRDSLARVLENVRASNYPIYDEICKYLDVGGYQALVSILTGDKNIQLSNITLPNGTGTQILTSLATILWYLDSWISLSSPKYKFNLTCTGSHAIDVMTAIVISNSTHSFISGSTLDFNGLYGYALIFQVGGLLNNINFGSVVILDGTSSGYTCPGFTGLSSKITVIENDTNIIIASDSAEFNIPSLNCFKGSPIRVMNIYRKDSGWNGRTLTLSLANIV